MGELGSFLLSNAEQCLEKGSCSQTTMLLFSWLAIDKLSKREVSKGIAHWNECFLKWVSNPCLDNPIYHMISPIYPDDIPNISRLFMAKSRFPSILQSLERAAAACFFNRLVRKEDERKRLLERRAKKAQEAKNAKKGKVGSPLGGGWSPLGGGWSPWSFHRKIWGQPPRRNQLSCL